ncbi:MAG: hypothetical protein RBS99_02405 [Rhodospirillales bacterium]|nr:hypothetical protein [Rhodospirillales bacterium]
MNETPAAARDIPLIEAGGDGALPALEAAPERLAELVAAARRHYGPTTLRLADLASRRWLEKTANPYLGEIAGVAGRVGEPGVYMLNLSYEWSCTSGVGPDPAGPGNRLLRTLDWPLDGLGRAVVVSRHETVAGAYLNVTWPGFAGITTAVAPGRFAAAINQPPMRWTSPLMALDWLANRLGVWRQGGLPPVHLLRRVFDECRTYAEAKAMLAETAVCLPAFFSLSGLEPDECCAIERLETRAAVRDGPASTANHWIRFQVAGRARGSDSVGRFRRMEAVRRGAAAGFGWVTPPILNAATRVAVVANARAGRLAVQGWEAEHPATPVFSL